MELNVITNLIPRFKMYFIQLMHTFFTIIHLYGMNYIHTYYTILVLSIRVNLYNG